MAHQPRPAISSQLVGVVAEKACSLGLHSVRQQRSRAIAQNLCQRIAESPWLGELDHIILGHGLGYRSVVDLRRHACGGPTPNARA
jgi:hypothetical protein